MEGIVDQAMTSSTNLLKDKSSKNILLYSGGIYEKYGIKNLIEAFMQLKASDLRLHIYGAGPMANSMDKYMTLDSRIKYLGVVPNSVLIPKQQEATLLINPRPTVELFTNYSFPSKNMEYMASGTPVVTTLLPGMPKEYLKYVYLLKDESVNGIYEVLFELLSKSKEELHDYGARAKDFVLTNKNNFVQAQKVISLITEVCKSSA